MPSLRAFGMTLTRRLLLWSGGSILVGLGLLGTGDPFWWAFGIQAIVWGMADGLTALLGRRSFESRYRHSEIPGIPRGESARLRRLLLINTALNALYVLGGLTLALSLGQREAVWRGHGWGIVIQGVFLFFFDLHHAQRVPVGMASIPLQTFNGDEHLPFQWKSGKPAALLVHGFPGTPAEMRPLAAALHQEGWTVQGILLPGFGPQIATLDQRHVDEWLEAIGGAIGALRREHAPLLLVGYSMGGSLSLCAATRWAPEGLVLLAPFWWPETWLTRCVSWLLRPFLPQTFRPLGKANLADPQLRQFLTGFLPGVDLDDPDTQHELREIVLPLHLFDLIRETSRLTYRQAAELRIPTLVVQGRGDEAVRPGNTLRLLRRLPVPASYVEVDAAHGLLNPSGPVWLQVREAVIQYAASVARRFGNRDPAAAEG